VGLHPDTLVGFAREVRVARACKAARGWRFPADLCPADISPAARNTRRAPGRSGSRSLHGRQHSRKSTPKSDSDPFGTQLSPPSSSGASLLPKPTTLTGSPRDSAAAVDPDPGVAKTLILQDRVGGGEPITALFEEVADVDLP